MVNALVLRAPGTNCEHETVRALELSGAHATLAHVWDVIERKNILQSMDMIIIPGGFAYGDDIEAGRLLANELKHRLLEELKTYVSSGRILIGICNGFQVLVSMGILPDITGEWKQEGALVLNASGHFEDRWVNIRIEPSSLSLLSALEGEILYAPVNHAEGQFVAMDTYVLQHIESHRQVWCRYVDQRGRPTDAYPDNPNGSTGAIAGLCNAEGNVFGLMPHLEKYVERIQHPNWRRNDLPNEGDGLKFFRACVQAAAKD